MTEINQQTGGSYRWQRRLPGGEQGGAHLVLHDGRTAVLTWHPAGWRADRLIAAFPVVAYATEQGWPAARWTRVGRLRDGGAFLLQEHAPGTPVSRLDVRAAQAVVAANAAQRDLALDGAHDDAAHLEAVLSGDHPWKAQVAGCTPAGAAVVQHGDAVVARLGRAPLPRTDLVHGDCSSSNLLLDPVSDTITFVDCETVGRGSRVRDLADLYRQTFAYPHPQNTGSALLREAAVAAEGPEVFVRCAVAVTYDNLAWWVEHRSVSEFEAVCARMHGLFDDLRRWFS